MERSSWRSAISEFFWSISPRVRSELTRELAELAGDLLGLATDGLELSTGGGEIGLGVGKGEGGNAGEQHEAGKTRDDRTANGKAAFRVRHMRNSSMRALRARLLDLDEAVQFLVAGGGERLARFEESQLQDTSIPY